MALNARTRRLLRALCLLLLVAGVTYPLWRPTPKFQGRPVRDWVHEAIHGESPSNDHARDVVTKKIPKQAIPFIVKELKGCCRSPLRTTLQKWQAKLPRRLWVIPGAPDTRGAIANAATLLSEMGEVAHPAIPTLMRCLDEAPMFFFEGDDVMTDLVHMAPLPKDVLPSLRRMALDPAHKWSVQAALAIYGTDGSLDCLAAAISNNIAFHQGSDVEGRELYCFRKDPAVIECVESQLRRVSTNGANVRWNLRDESPSENWNVPHRAIHAHSPSPNPRFPRRSAVLIRPISCIACRGRWG